MFLKTFNKKSLKQKNEIKIKDKILFNEKNTLKMIKKQNLNFP